MAEEPATPDVADLNRRFAEAWNRRDIEAWMSFFAPDAVWDGPAAPGSLEARMRSARWRKTGWAPTRS
jgi:ketosteroid isomerase-like protein